jgi:hypothetical protein
VDSTLATSAGYLSAWRRYCGDHSEADLLALRNQVDIAKAGGNATVIDARCGQCVQRVAPHLRRGPVGNHDPNREAFCALSGVAGAAFVYTDEDPETILRSQPNRDSDGEQSR